MDQRVWWWSSCCPVQHIDNIKPPINKFLLFLEISWFALVLMLGGGVRSRLTRITPGSVRITRGGRGAGRAASLLAEDFPAWETGDHQAKLEGSQCVAISSPLDILLVGAPPGACKSQPLQFFGLRVGGGARQGDLMRNRR